MVLPKLPTVRAKRDVGTALAEINVTPFVDVMLVLLVIFMVTAPMMQSGIGVDLPTAETDTAPAEDGLQVMIGLDRAITVGGNPVNINILEKYLQNAFVGKPKKIVFLLADTNLPFGSVIDILDIVKKAGIEIVGIRTQPKEKKAGPK